MTFLTESRPITKDWNPSMDGMVRCCNCLCFTDIGDSKVKKCRHAWHPACSPEKWRRCRLYEARTKR